MHKDVAEHTLEFLLAFDGRRHWYDGGYCLKFDIRRVATTTMRPHGLRYSLTLHDPTGKRLMGFDNAHVLKLSKAQGGKLFRIADHWHHTSADRG
jgi:hypothetical protein